MRLTPFKLERYFAKYEFSVQYLLSPSDCESLSLSELLGLADADGLKRWHNLGLGYTESQGHPILRDEVSRLYQRITPDEVLVAVPEEAIFIAMNAILDKGDSVVVTFPGYQSLYEVAPAVGCEVNRWSLAAKDNKWTLDLDWLENSIGDRTRLLVVNFPHNPTGYLPSIDELNAIIDIARRHHLYIFSDEMYRLLEHDPARRLPSVCDVYERGVSLFGLSKTFSLPGLRIGWLATQDKDLLARFIVFKDYTTICASAPSEVLGIIALRAKDKIVERNLDIIRSNLRAADQFFAEFGGQFSWLKPRGGSIAFPKLMSTVPVEQFCQEVLERKNVMIVPGSEFEFPGNHFRLGLGRKNMPESLGRVREYIRESGWG